MCVDEVIAWCVRPGLGSPLGDVMHHYRTHTCGQLTTADVGDEVRLSGWLHNRRDLGGLLLVDLRDHYGLGQLVIRPDSSVFEQLADLPFSVFPEEPVSEELRLTYRFLDLRAPLHGGIAPDIARIVMLLADEPNIRETIAFPLNQNAQDLMMGAPGTVLAPDERYAHDEPVIYSKASKIPYFLVVVVEGCHEG